MKYIYIDDDPNSNNKIQGFESEDLFITTEQHQNSWEEQMRHIKEIEKSIDGMILDLKLDDMPNKNKIRADFRGTSLAQEIRTRQKEGLLKAFPIVLFSANDKVDLAMENSGRDLFDVFIDKSNIDIDSFTIYNSQLIALSEGYKELIANNNLGILLNTDINLLDSRFITEFEELNNTPVHVQARFFVTEVLEKQGLLIDEDVLAARLGIDKNNSEDWGTLKQRLECAKYNGFFSKGWDRWWAHLVEKWWIESVGAHTSLRMTSSTLRVQIIKEYSGLCNIVVATKINKAESDEFWTVCKGYGKPLDTIDGLLICGQENLYPWQEPEYVSIDAALKKKGVNHWHDLADVEKEHYEELKVIYSHKTK